MLQTHFYFKKCFLKYLNLLFITTYLIFFKLRLNPAQHGFRKFNSTTTNLVTYLISIMPTVCTRGQIDSVYFDTVPHNILLHKLSNFGLSSSYVDWFRSCLDNRYFSVRISGTLSFSFTVKSVAPQGSTIGPLLFNIFINDICNTIHNYRYLLFADD
jgi:sarcosine oxidase/L-pipecolate oxidase